MILSRAYSSNFPEIHRFPFPQKFPFSIAMNPNNFSQNNDYTFAIHDDWSSSQRLYNDPMVKPPDLALDKGLACSFMGSMHKSMQGGEERGE